MTEKGSMKTLLALAILTPGMLVAAQTARPAAPSSYRLDKITVGVYLAVPAAPAPNSANIPVIVSDQDVILVGSHLSPAAARALIEQVKTITDKPVRFIVNTHYHASQPGGREAYPAGIEVIGHELARRAVLFDATGRPKPASAIAATPPTLGMTTRLSLYRGDREIRILYIGRGHTDNDLVVLLPKERILCTGDLAGAVLPDMSDGSITDWVSTLEAMKVIDFETVLPARGAPFTGKNRLSALQSYMRDVLSLATDSLNQKVSVEDTARRLDLRSHQKDFPEIRGLGVDVNAVRHLQTQIEEPEPPWDANP
jgi:cyclase